MSDNPDIVEEAKEGYEEAKEGHEAIKDALVDEYGSDTTVVDFGNGVTAEVDSSPGIARVKEIQHLSQKLDDDVDGGEFIDNIHEWCEGVATLILEDEWDADLLVGIANDDIVAFKKVLDKLLDAIDIEDMQIDEDAVKSFP